MSADPVDSSQRSPGSVSGKQIRERSEMNPGMWAKSAEEGIVTPRERVEAAFRFEEVHPVPYHIWMEPEVEARLDAHLPSPAA